MYALTFCILCFFITLGFDWASLPRGSVIVDVGGGIGSTTMILATAFASTEDDALSLRFVIQDRAVVCEMGEKVRCVP
jgi:hypothetical protein